MGNKFKIVIAYDGTNYCGWQKQPNGASIQSTIEYHMQRILRHLVNVVGSGRTDRGVHATGQVIHFYSDNVKENFLYSLNAIFPKDIFALSIEPVTDNFHARFSAKSKVYRYNISKRRTVFNRLYTYHFPYDLSIEEMKEACKYFLGTHNFKSFANFRGISDYENYLRTIYGMDIVENQEGFSIICEGDGFLYKMVRNIVGVLLEIGRGKRHPQWVLELFDAQERGLGADTVPPQGLFLEVVKYYV